MDTFYFEEDLVDQKNPTINNLRFNDTIFFKQKIFKKRKISNHRYTRLKIQKGSLDFLEGARGCHLKNSRGLYDFLHFYLQFIFPKLPSRQGTKSCPRHPPVIMYVKAESPRLKLKAKASIWLVLFPLRSMNTVNERPFFLYVKHVRRKSYLWMFWIHFFRDA